MLASKIFIDGLKNLDVGVENLHRWARKSRCWRQKSSEMGSKISMLTSKIFIDGFFPNLRLQIGFLLVFVCFRPPARLATPPDRYLPSAGIRGPSATH
eukprot:440333-Karenia_brevis.AAC.1